MSKISELSDGGVIQSGDTLIAVRSGGNVKVTYGGTTTANIDGGTIDGTVIGGSSAAAGTFTSITGTSANINGTVTADGLTVDSSGTAALFTNGDGLTQLGKIVSDATYGFVLEGKVNSNLTLKTKANGAGEGTYFLDTANNKRMFIEGTTGDISFYEDTGTTAKFFWDASAESLGIGTTTPNASYRLDVFGSVLIQSNLRVEGTQIRVVGASSAASPSIQPGNDGDTGIFHPTTNNIGFSTAGVERARIDGSGNVGIGTTSPTRSLHVNSGTTDVTVLLESSDANNWMSMWDGTGGVSIRNVSGSMGFISGGTSSSGGDGSEAARIDSSGNLLVGKTSAGALGTAGIEIRADNSVYVTRDGNPLAYFNRLTSDGDIVRFQKDGTTVGSISVTASSTAYNTSSDYRLKENVVSMDNAGDRVLALNPVRFNFIADPDKTVDGFLAHEAQEVVPEAVHGVKDEVDDEGNPVYQGIDQSKLVPLLTKALQEALTEIADLKARVNALETN